MAPEAVVAQLAEHAHGKGEARSSILRNGSDIYLLCVIQFDMKDIQQLTEQFCEYSTFIRGYAKPTIQRYRNVIGFYARWANINCIDQISGQNVRAYLLHGRSERAWAPNTYISHLKTLNVFFRWCVENGYQRSNPADGIEVPRIPKSLPKRLSQAEATSILDVAWNYPYQYRYLRFRNRAIFATFLYAGLRKGELLNLSFADVDLEGGTIFVRQGKGGKDRMIPINGTLRGYLHSYLQERTRLRKTCTAFFASLNRDCAFTDIGLRRLIKKIAVTSGVQFSSHQLRHTFATLMLEGACDIYSLSKLMGHSDIKTTTIYLAASPEHLRDQVAGHPLG